MYTFGTSIKLGLAVEMSPKVFSEQFTNCERMSQAASADSVLLSTCKGQMMNSVPKMTTVKPAKWKTQNWHACYNADTTLP